MAIKPEHHKALHWIARAIKNKGSLRKTLGAKAGEPIPEAKLEKAAHGSGVTAKRARLAETLRAMKH